MFLHELNNGLQRNVTNGNACAHFHEHYLLIVFHRNKHGNSLLGSLGTVAG